MFDRQAYEQFLFAAGCVGFFDPPITLKSGRPGHWYVNMRNALASEAKKYQLAGFLYAFARQEGLQPDFFLGVPDGATPLGQACNTLIDYKDRSDIPAAVLRAGAKSHGSPSDRYSVGPLPAGRHAVLLEDVTTTGGSSMEHILRLQEVGIPIDALVSCVSRFERRDRGRTVADVLERDYHVRYHALADARSLLPKAVERLQPPADLVRDIEAYYRTYGVEPIALRSAV